MKWALFITVLAMTACGRPAPIAEDEAYYKAIEVEGMPCIAYARHTMGNKGYGGLTCDWLKHRSNRG